MPNMHLVLIVVAVVCFALGLWSASAPHWPRLLAAGLAALALAHLV